MEKKFALKVIEGDTSQVFISDYKNKNALISLSSLFLLFVIPIFFIGITGSILFAHLFWVIPVAITYGLYSMLSNEAVFYVSKKDLGYNFGLFAVPFVALLVGLTMNEYVMMVLFILSILGSLYLFGLKSANANAILNSELNLIQQVCVMFTKSIMVLIFLFALFGQVSKMSRGSEIKKKSVTLAEYNRGRDEQLAGAAGLAIVSAIGIWFYHKSINTEEVFIKRGILP
jgi:hypothetical protein